MSLVLDTPEARETVAGLGPYARHVLERAADTALRLHADEISPEHYLTTLLLDEEAGATRLVLHAFADPETLAVEIQALAPGILVVGSRRSLPFSMRGVRALEEARRRAAAGGGAVLPAGLLAAAVEELEDDARGELVAEGYVADGLDRSAPSPGEPRPGFYGPFTDEARRVLSAACRLAVRNGRGAISPAHLVLGAFEVERGLENSSGLAPHRARRVLARRDADETPPAERPLGPDEELLGLLAAAGRGADTSAIFGRCLAQGSENLRLLFAQQKITPALHRRSGAAFGDPEPPGGDGSPRPTGPHAL